VTAPAGADAQAPGGVRATPLAPSEDPIGRALRSRRVTAERGDVTGEDYFVESCWARAMAARIPFF
jgi:hypothetical protein